MTSSSPRTATKYPKRTCDWCRRRIDKRRFKGGSRRCERCVTALQVAKDNDITATRGEGAKACPHCGVVKRFSPTRERSEFSKNKSQACGYNTWCRACQNELMMDLAAREDFRRHRQAYRRKRRDDPRVRELKRISDKVAYHRVRNDPERWEQRLINARMDRRLRAEREGKVMQMRTAPSGYKPMGHRPEEALPEAPLRAWLNAFILSKGNDVDLVSLADELGVNERVLNGIRRAEYRTRQLGLADTLLTRCGRSVNVPGYGYVEHVEDLWPDELGELAA